MAKREYKTGVNSQFPEIKQAAQLTPRLIEILADRFPPDRIAETIEKLLTATHLTKGGQKIDDNRAIEAGVKLLLAYQIGLPVQRQEIVQMNIDGDAQVEERMLKSPAVRQALREKLDALDKGTEADVVEIPIEPEKINRIEETVKEGKTSPVLGVLRRVKKTKQKTN